MEGKLLFISITLLLSFSCSERQVYEGLQISNRSSCYNLPVNQRQPCLDELRSVNYDEYKRELEKNKNAN